LILFLTGNIIPQSVTNGAWLVILSTY